MKIVDLYWKKIAGRKAQRELSMDTYADLVSDMSIDEFISAFYDGDVHEMIRDNPFIFEKLQSYFSGEEEFQSYKDQVMDWALQTGKLDEYGEEEEVEERPRLQTRF